MLLSVSANVAAKTSLSLGSIPAHQPARPPELLASEAVVSCSCTACCCCVCCSALTAL